MQFKSSADPVADTRIKTPTALNGTTNAVMQRTMENRTTANPPFDRRLRVLIGEDSGRMRENLTKVLSVLLHFEIVGEAKDGLKAIETVRNLAPDAIILDIQIPKVNGLEVLRAPQKNKSKGKVIRLTTLADEFYRKRCRDLSVRHFFDKITEFNQINSKLLSGASGVKGKSK